MFKSLARKSTGSARPCKYKFDVDVLQLDNIPAAVKKCRIVWSRKAKVQMTETVEPKRGRGLSGVLLARSCRMAAAFVVSSYSRRFNMAQLSAQIAGGLHGPQLLLTFCWLP